MIYLILTINQQESINKLLHLHKEHIYILIREHFVRKYLIQQEIMIMSNVSASSINIGIYSYKCVLSKVFMREYVLIMIQIQDLWDKMVIIGVVNALLDTNGIK